MLVVIRDSVLHFSRASKTVCIEVLILLLAVNMSSIRCLKMLEDHLLATITYVHMPISIVVVFRSEFEPLDA